MLNSHCESLMCIFYLLHGYASNFASTTTPSQAQHIAPITRIHTNPLNSSMNHVHRPLNEAAPAIMFNLTAKTNAQVSEQRRGRSTSCAYCASTEPCNAYGAQGCDDALSETSNNEGSALHYSGYRCTWRQMLFWDESGIRGEEVESEMVIGGRGDVIWDR